MFKHYSNYRQWFVSKEHTYITIYSNCHRPSKLNWFKYLVKEPPCLEDTKHYLEWAEGCTQKSMPMTLRYCSYSPRQMFCNECMIIENVEFCSFLPPFALLGHGQGYEIMSKNHRTYNTVTILFNFNTHTRHYNMAVCKLMGLNMKPHIILVRTYSWKFLLQKIPIWESHLLLPLTDKSVNETKQLLTQ